MSSFCTRRSLLKGALVWPISRSTSTAADGNISSARVPEGYKLVFGDEFDDPDVWRINDDASGGRPGAPAWRSRFRHPRRDVTNGEKQVYMDGAFSGRSERPLNVHPFRIANSVLDIIADRADPARVSSAIWNYRYTSGCISSELTHWQRYGFFEMRARLPAGRGFWPAFWLLPKRPAWPPEIDVVEASGARPRSIWSNVHSQTRNDAQGFEPGSVPPAGRWIEQIIDITKDFNVYSMEWTSERITCFFNGRPFSDTRGHGIHEDMYVIANLAIGSHSPGWIPDPDDSTPFPRALSIDYIRCYSRI